MPTFRKLNNFLHLPVQSGSDRILAAMKRGHTVLEYKQKLRKLRAVRPDICISTDIIVGFPGESDEDFMATMNLVADVGFDQSFSFIYSRRPGTPAAALPDEVPHEVKQQRLELLQQRLNAQARAISQRMVGSRQRVLVERPAKRNPRQLAGRTDNNRWVNFDGPAARSDEAHQSVLRTSIITEAMPNSLRGRLVDDAAAVSSVPMTRDLLLAPADNVRLVELCGPLDEHLHQIEARLGRRSATARQSISNHRPARRHQARRSGIAGPVCARAARARGFGARAYRAAGTGYGRR